MYIQETWGSLLASASPPPGQRKSPPGRWAGGGQKESPALRERAGRRGERKMKAIVKTLVFAIQIAIMTLTAGAVVKIMIYMATK